MTSWWFRDAPNLLAVLDQDLVCRQASHGWRSRLGLKDSAEALDLPLSELFLLERTAGLADRLRQGLEQATALQDLPISLTGNNLITEGLADQLEIRFERSLPGGHLQHRSASGARRAAPPTHDARVDTQRRRGRDLRVRP